MTYIYLHVFCIFKEEAEVLYTALIDQIQTADAAIPCPQFSSVYDRLQKINSDTLKSKLQEQYQVSLIKSSYIKIKIKVKIKIKN